MSGSLEKHTHTKHAGGIAYALSWREAVHSFARPLVTAHGHWAARQSIVIKLQSSDGRCGYGEMAPIKAFGSPDIITCQELCRNLGNKPKRSELLSMVIPDCARFAFGSAIAMIEGRLPRRGRWPLARLLPSGPRALFEASKRIHTGSRCFKYKLRGIPDSAEREIICMLFESLRNVGGRLRIDANGSMTSDGVNECLGWLSEMGCEALDFVEQPLPPGHEKEMLALMEKTGIKIALDESATGMDALNTWINWPGVLVIKPALAGDPLELLRLIDEREERTILSSAFESPVGLWGCLLSIGRTPEPLGFGIDIWPEADAWGEFTGGSTMDSASITLEDMEAVWNSLGT